MTTTSLSSKVYTLLNTERPDLAEVFQSTFSTVPTSDEDELKALNRYFRAQLSKAPVPTSDERGCLVDNLAPDIWLKYFRSHALPTLLRFNLPSE